MAKDTKEKILDAALDLFSKYGYDGTNLQEIADNVGIVKSALYRHFVSKEELWNALIDKMHDYYNQRFGSRKNIKIPNSLKELEQMTLKMIDFTMHDEKIIKVRKVLLTEQFKDKKAKEFATIHFNEGLENLFTQIFNEMIKNKLIKDYDSKLLAFEYTMPISSLIQLCDRQPERENEINKKIKKFIKHFICVYGIK